MYKPQIAEIRQMGINLPDEYLIQMLIKYNGNASDVINAVFDGK